MQWRIKTAVIAMIIMLTFSNAYSKCSGNFINPVTDVNWKGIFPITIGNVISMGSNEDSPKHNLDSPICVCGAKIGISFGVWEPARLMDTVKDPYCFPAIGTSFSNPKPGFLGGVNKTHDTHNPTVFQQVHWYVFPVFALLDMFVDSECLHSDNQFDLAMITEIDPLWNSDMTAFLLNPEALLFGNPVTQLSCITDSIAANAGYPIDQLFWCMGSWGSAYPLTGHLYTKDYVQGNAGVGARFIYKLSREMLLLDTGVDVCGPSITPIWKKSHYKFQMVRPTRGSDIIPIGRSAIIWGSGKNNPAGSGGNSPDNFTWLIFRDKICCETFY